MLCPSPSPGPSLLGVGMDLGLACAPPASPSPLQTQGLLLQARRGPSPGPSPGPRLGCRSQCSPLRGRGLPWAPVTAHAWWPPGGPWPVAQEELTGSSVRLWVSQALPHSTPAPGGDSSGSAQQNMPREQLARELVIRAQSAPGSPETLAVLMVIFKGPGTLGPQQGSLVRRGAIKEERSRKQTPDAGQARGSHHACRQSLHPPLCVS